MIKNITIKSFLIVYKIFFGLLALTAVITEIIVLIDRGRFVPANFFSFFTIESNLFAASVLIFSAVALLRNKPAAYLAMLRGAATLYMVTTGIVFAVLLSGLEATLLTAVPWDNIVLHYIMPLALLFDWFIDPPNSRITFKRALMWLAYPLVYVVYSLARGPLVGWYPYPFLNPATNGYAGVAVTGVGIAVVVVVLTWLLLLVAGRTLRKSSQ